MRKILLLSIATIVSTTIFCQNPKVYINFVSHNEPGDTLHSQLPFLRMYPKVQQLADIIDAKGASWNLETCDGMASGALKYQGKTSNIFKTIVSGKYADNIEIDPRNKQTIYTNIADLYHILDSLGAKPTQTLGGFMYYSKVQDKPIDWYQYQDTIVGGMYPKVKWKCKLMYGAGSNPPHTNDLNDYGIWKPKSESEFYSHLESNTAYFIGNGCQPLAGLDSTEDHQIIISHLRNFVDSINDGLIPSDKFVAYTIMINQAHFGPTLFQKVSAICDSVNTWGADFKWAKLSDKLAAFETWKSSTINLSSQLACGEKATELSKITSTSTNLSIYPNPTEGIFTVRSSNQNLVKVLDNIGRLVYSKKAENSETLIDLSDFTKGIYFINDGTETVKLIIE